MIFDIKKNDLLQLSDEQLEELVARLAEAELASVGYSPAYVSWSGSINAPDEGVDIRVVVPGKGLATGFLARPNTVFQAKKHSMPASSIAGEMCPGEILSPTISQLAALRGSYIIVSLADDCSPPMKRDRLAAMEIAVVDDPNAGQLHLDFYDRSKIHQWLRQHPAVLLWARSALRQEYSGWQPYGLWSNPPLGADDTLITSAGVKIKLPTDGDKVLSIENGIEPLRDLVKLSSKAIRIIGLSGVGKTRIVQALFDENIGEGALDRTIAIYVDTGASPEPSAHAMLETLITENRKAVMVLDNCPSDLHSTLATKVSASGSNVSLITVEYDIREDKPQTTEVVQIIADGPDIAEELLLRRFPEIGQLNARKIAEYADGNSRLSLAIAERMELGESLANLSDAQLFDRLFQQRNQPDDNLRAPAELLSLVYSFSVSTAEVGPNELEALGAIYDIPRIKLFRSVAVLLERQIAQRRSHWRAILPQAIANRLACDALKRVSIETLREAFEAPGHERLLMSFAHRLGMLHDDPVAQQIVQEWLHDGIVLRPILALDDNATRILEYVAPVAPAAVLDRIEVEISADSFIGFESILNSRRTTILSLLLSLAYDPEAFARCISLLLRIAEFENETNSNDATSNSIAGLFQPYLSGTHATLEQRLEVVREAVVSSKPKRRSIGFCMLSTALAGPSWTSSGHFDFGARPRDFGLQPSEVQFVEWRKQFIELAVTLGLDDDFSEIAGPARNVLAKNFSGLWEHPLIREDLVTAAKRLNSSKSWSEGWKAVRNVIFFNYEVSNLAEKTEAIPEELVNLEAELAPSDLLATIETFVLGSGGDHWTIDKEFNSDEVDNYKKSEQRLTAKAEELGCAFVDSGNQVSALGPNLFVANGYLPYRRAFGRGLAKTNENNHSIWSQLVDALNRYEEQHFDCSVFCGYIEENNNQDRRHSQVLLDLCLANSRLQTVIVALHPTGKFDQVDFDRCTSLLHSEGVKPWIFGALFWHDSYSSIANERLLKLADQLIEKTDGDSVILDALSMKLHRTEPDVDTLGVDLRRIGLIAARCCLLDSEGRHDDHAMEKVIRAALTFDGNEVEKSAWLDTIFSLVDKSFGFFQNYTESIATTASKIPNEFLDRVFSGNEKSQCKRQLFIQNSRSDKSPLAKIEIAVLIGWCKSQNTIHGWQSIGGGIPLWFKNDEEKTIELEQVAVRFLEAAPDPGAVLEAFARKLEPTRWTGSRAAIMERRAHALQVLTQHIDPNISCAAEKLIANFPARIEAEYEREQRRNEAQEQRFE